MIEIIFKNKDDNWHRENGPRYINSDDVIFKILR